MPGKAQAAACDVLPCAAKPPSPSPAGAATTSPRLPCSHTKERRYLPAAPTRCSRQRRSFPKIIRIRSRHPCRPPIPAHRLNQVSPGSGTPSRFNQAEIESWPAVSATAMTTPQTRRSMAFVKPISSIAATVVTVRGCTTRDVRTGGLVRSPPPARAHRHHRARRGRTAP